MVLLRQSVTLNYTPASGDITSLPMGSGLIAVASGVPSIVGDTLLTETFEDSDFAGRGWYDGAQYPLDTGDPFAGVSAADFTWQSGNTIPDPANGNQSGRIAFAASDRAFVQFRIRHSSNYVGSGDTFHPHLVQLITNQDSAFVGPAGTRLTVGIETNYQAGIIGRFSISDVTNIDQNNVGVDLTGSTEIRSTMGCNGLLENTQTGAADCFGAPPNAANGRRWDDPNISIIDSEKVNWHKIGAYVQLNSIVGGIGQTDGILRMWIDDVLVMDHTTVVLRTGQHPAMLFNQLLIGPFIGSGSPATQTIFIDDLVVTRDAPLVPVPPNPPPGGVPDLLDNASFETDFDGFMNTSGGLPTGSGGATITRSTEQVFEGSFSARSFMPTGQTALQFNFDYGVRSRIFMRTYFFATGFPNDNRKWLRFQQPGFGPTNAGLYTNAPNQAAAWSFQNSSPGNINNRFDSSMGRIDQFINAWHWWEIEYDTALNRVRFWFDGAPTMPDANPNGNCFIDGEGFLVSGGGPDGSCSILNIDNTTNGGNSISSITYYDRIALSTNPIGPFA